MPRPASPRAEIPQVGAKLGRAGMPSPALFLARLRAPSRKQEAGSRKQEAGSRKQEAGSRKQECGLVRQSARAGHWPTASRLSSAPARARDAASRGFLDRQRRLLGGEQLA